MEHTIRARLSKAKGFTLIELLIVIAIIGILTVAFLPTLRGGQAQARDAARKAVLADIMLAIEQLSNGTVANQPAQVPVGAAASVCLSGAATPGSAVVQVLARTPSVTLVVGSTLCNGAGQWNVYYRTFDSAGAPTNTAGTATNYVLLTQVENAANANVAYATAPTSTANADTIFSTFGATLTATAATAPASQTGGFFYAVTK